MPNDYSQPIDFMAGFKKAGGFGAATPYMQVPQMPGNPTQMLNLTKGGFDVGGMSNYGSGVGPIAADVSPYSLTPQNLNITMGDATRNFAPAANLNLGSNKSFVNGGAGGGARSWYDNMVGYKDESGAASNGWGGLALGAAQGLFSGYLGMQQLGLAKDQLATQKEQWGLNFGAQQKTTNERLATRQARRNKENSSSMPAGEYMAKYGI